MSTATLTQPNHQTVEHAGQVRQPLGVGQRLFTAADLAALPDELPSGPVKWELDNGRLIAMPPPGAEHGKSQNKVGVILHGEGEKKGHGEAFAEVGIVLWREPFERIVGADNAFVSSQRLPLRLSREGYLETIPDLVAEVRSKNDTSSEIDQKVADYLAAGVRIVWVIDPAARIVTVCRPGQAPKVLTAEELLTAEDVIPGLNVKVAELF